jgi:hypothetical protein
VPSARASIDVPGTSAVRERGAPVEERSIWISVRPETEVMFWEAKQPERGERLDEDAVLEALWPGVSVRCADIECDGGGRG